ncbi:MULTISPECIES: diacylglycerol/lipid kinase family protein [Streptomyces]|uniref:diacylglycerol/lipid kinase family protein n=1 Tax=Streptomyces TaxID=1883 RepID=UPI00055C2BD0|nr:MULTISPECIES: diacylglycerol kinase family protein [Streptomyces]AKL69003.1 diacylglycerol kinase [Streptomyces sp. Mg1]RPK33859.1 Diacylglycerol kinase [Streptomyces sp. ADI91-18]WBY23271.1 diacylglycerol kinase family protein [Streptomyces goshikiensis]
MGRRWAARLSLAAGVAALLVLVVFGGLVSLVLMGVGWAGLALSAAGVWWMLTHTGRIRVLAVLLLVAVPLAVLALYAAAGLLWVVLVSLGLWALAVFAGRAALVEDAPPAMPEHPARRPERPFLIMNPRSGGGKVTKFRLAERARALGAEVVVLDPDRPQDVVQLAREAVRRGADLLGVAGGDGTQALVAGVAVAHDLPFVVISAGTRNHFALDLGLDRKNPARCLEALTDGVELRVDLGYLRAGGPEEPEEPAEPGTEAVFVNSASFGVYAEVVQSPAYRDDKVRTILEMLPDLLAQESGARLSVRGDGPVLDAPQAVLVSNNPYQRGDSAGLGRRERLDTGELGVLGVHVGSAAEAAELLLRGGQQGRGLTETTAREVVVDADAPVIPVGVDGEALTLPTPVRCRLAPGALRVRVPRHRPGVRLGAPPMDWRRVRRLALTMGRAAAGRGPA